MVALVLLALLASSEEWQTVEDAGGISLEARAVRGKHFDELRLRTHSSYAVEKLCNAVWGSGKFDAEEPGLKARTLLEDKGNERLVYEQIATPVSDRDYTILAKRISDKSTGVCQVFFENKNDRGPPPAKGYVRIPLVYGSWTFEPSDKGGTDISYFIYSDPGGSIPAFMAKGAQKASAKKRLAMVLKKAAKP